MKNVIMSALKLSFLALVISSATANMASADQELCDGGKNQRQCGGLVGCVWSDSRGCYAYQENYPRGNCRRFHECMNECPDGNASAAPCQDSCRSNFDPQGRCGN